MELNVPHLLGTNSQTCGSRHCLIRLRLDMTNVHSTSNPVVVPLGRGIDESQDTAIAHWQLAARYQPLLWEFA